MPAGVMPHMPRLIILWTSLREACQRGSLFGSTEFECTRGIDDPVLAERVDALLLAVGGSEFSQKRVSLPSLYLPHDVVFGKPATFFREYGLDQLACQLMQQPD